MTFDDGVRVYEFRNGGGIEEEAARFAVFRESEAARSPSRPLPGHEQVAFEAVAAEALGVRPGPRAGMSAEQVGELYERVRRGLRAEEELRRREQLP